MNNQGRGSMGRGPGGPRKGPEFPKPFKMIALAGGKESRCATEVGHERLHPEWYYGHLTLRLGVVTPLHVGSGLYDLEKGLPVRAQLLRKVGEEYQAFVPGTSLKGAVRAAVEAISRSCVRVGKREVLQNLSVQGLEPCSEARSKSRDAARLCVACALFGGQGYEGRLSFSDALGVKGKAPELGLMFLPAPYPPRLEGKIYSRDRRFTGRKFYEDGTPPIKDLGDAYKVIKPNEALQFRLNLHGVSREELALILTAMGCLDEDFDMKLGGGKQARLGTVDLEVTRASLTGGPEEGGRSLVDSFTDWDAGPRVLRGDALKTWLEGLKAIRLMPQGLVLEAQFAALRSIWAPSEREAPTGTY